MNGLEQFSEERLKKMSVGDDFPTTPEMAELARIALSAKQAKPVAEVYQPANIGICAALGPAIRMINVGLPAGTFLYTTPQPANAEQDGYWYEVECYKYKGPAKLCAGNDGPAWFFPGSDLLVDNDEVKVIGRTAAPNPE